MKIDLHCHSKYSRDNFLEPAAAIRAAHRRGLDGLCFTEHDSQRASWPIERVAAPEGLLVLRGIEISTDAGHLLAYGLIDDAWNSWERHQDLPAQEVIDTIHDLGGVCVAAHPFRGYDSIGVRADQLRGLDAVETHNGRDRPSGRELAIKLAETLALPSVGGSDAHRAEHVGRTHTEFDRPIRSMEDLVAAIREGACRGRVT